MPPKPRNIDPDAYYHVISRGNNKHKLFLDSADYDHYLRLVEATAIRFPVTIIKYVLMPNHVHFLLRPNGEYLPKFMQIVNRGYARHFAARYEFIGHVWQGRYKSIFIDSDAYLYTCGEYIENNPVRAGLCKDKKEWPFSSIQKMVTVT